MHFGLTALLFAAAVCTIQERSFAGGSPGGAEAGLAPLNLSLQPEPESVYAPPAPPRADAGVNEGGVNFELTLSYFTDYVFRGIELFDPEDRQDQFNLQIDGKLSFDLGRAPHPFVGAFVNIADDDPISTFQEIRPYVGFDWFVRPLIVSAGYTSYIYPDRDPLETQEVWIRLELDDSYFLRTDEPLFSPYVFAAYDFDLYDGWYIEGGVSHEFRFTDIGLTLRAEAHVAYVHNIALFDATPGDGDDASGFQHYQLGLIARYSLNNLLNIPQRYGQWSLIGYLYYTDGIDNDLRADDQLWGGAGIGFRY
jgi:hypothetical protein